MSHPTRNDLKRQLVAQGFEVYRTLADQVLLADRVRDNLIMDSGVSAITGDCLKVRYVVRAQKSDFLGESEGQLFDRARGMAEPGVSRGYSEVGAETVPVWDPSDKSRVLDVFYEVSFEKEMHSLPELFEELRFALGLEKTAPCVAR